MLKRQELDQLRQKATPELIKDVQQLQKELVENKMKSAQGTISNVHAQKKLRKHIAQIKSLIQAKDLS